MATVVGSQAPPPAGSSPIPGSQFSVSAGVPVNVVTTSTGTGLPAPIAPDLNLEVFVGPVADMPPLFSGYQGLAVLTSGGHELDLISGAYAVTDNGTSGNDTLTAFGALETVTGSSSGTTLNLSGTSEVANAVGGNNLITVSGTLDTVNGGGNDTVAVLGFDDVVNGSPNGTDQYTINGNLDTVSTGGSATDTVGVSGSFDLVNLAGTDSVSVTNGSFDTVTAGAQTGANASTINLSSAVNTFTLAYGPNKYTDTVVGFNASAGDTIHLNSTDGGLANINAIVGTQVSENGGLDTLITLADGSTILLKGVAHVDSSFFS
jgi:hypothetical protein